MFCENDIQCLECGNIIQLDDDDVIQSGEVVWCPICGRAQNANPDGFYLDGFSVDDYEAVDESWTMNYLSDDLNGKWGAEDYERACEEFNEYEKYLQGETDENPISLKQIRGEALSSDRGNKTKRKAESTRKRGIRKTALSSSRKCRANNKKSPTNRRVAITHEELPSCVTEGPKRKWFLNTPDKD